MNTVTRVRCEIPTAASLNILRFRQNSSGPLDRTNSASVGDTIFN